MRQFFVALVLLSLSLAFTSREVKAEEVSLNGRADNALQREVEAATRFGLVRFEDQTVLRRFIESNALVRVPDQGQGFAIDWRIGRQATANRRFYRYALPATACFVRRLGEQYRRAVHGTWLVNSLVRTCAYQKRLARHNPNAVACDKTSHTTGATVDIGYKNISRKGRRWIESVLLTLERESLVQATKERHQAVYHVMVYPTYAQARACGRK